MRARRSHVLAPSAGSSRNSRNCFFECRQSLNVGPAVCRGVGDLPRRVRAHYRRGTMLFIPWSWPRYEGSHWVNCRPAVRASTSLRTRVVFAIRSILHSSTRAHSVERRRLIDRRPVVIAPLQSRTGSRPEGSHSHGASGSPAFERNPASSSVARRTMARARWSRAAVRSMTMASRDDRVDWQRALYVGNSTSPRRVLDAHVGLQAEGSITSNRRLAPSIDEVGTAGTGARTSSG